MAERLDRIDLDLRQSYRLPGALSKQAHDNAINAMHPIFATVTSTDMIIAHIRAECLAQVP